MKGRGAGPVTTYRLTPEEIAALSPAQPIPATHHKPLRFQSKEVNELHKSEPKHTKEEYLALLAEGNTRSSISRLWGISSPGLYPWLKKWGIKDQAEEEIALADFQQVRKQEPSSEDPKAESQPASDLLIPGENSGAHQADPEQDPPAAAEPLPEPEPSETIITRPKLPIEPPPSLPPLPRPSKFRRSFVVDLSGSREEIENELSGILAYVHATSAETLHLKLSVGEMAEQ